MRLSSCQGSQRAWERGSVSSREELRALGQPELPPMQPLLQSFGSRLNPSSSPRPSG